MVVRKFDLVARTLSWFSVVAEKKAKVSARPVELKPTANVRSAYSTRLNANSGLPGFGRAPAAFRELNGCTRRTLTPELPEWFWGCV
jgi:hypothetical protein